MARRASKMPWHAKPFFGGGRNSGWNVPPDTVPGAFAFVDQTDVVASATITSAPITVSGLDSPSPITISGGTYNKNGGSYTSSAGTVVNGDVVRVRHTSSASQVTAVNTVLTIGGVSDTFTSTTAVGVPEPRIVIDLTADTASNDGAPVAADTLLGTVAATSTYWDDSAYNSGNRTSAGLSGTSDNSPALIGAAAALALAGSTIVLEFLLSDAFDGGDGRPGVYVYNENGSNYVQANINPINMYVAGDGSDNFYSVASPSDSLTKDADGNINVFGVTLSAVSGSISANGSVAATKAMGTDWPTTDTPYVWLRLVPGYVLRKVEIYDPVDDADLPALSAL